MTAVERAEREAFNEWTKDPVIDRPSTQHRSWLVGALAGWLASGQRYRTLLQHERDAHAETRAEVERLRERLDCVRQALPEMWRNSEPSVAVATLVTEHQSHMRLGVTVRVKGEARAWFMDADLADEWAAAHSPGAQVEAD